MLTEIRLINAPMLLKTKTVLTVDNIYTLYTNIGYNTTIQLLASFLTFQEASQCFGGRPWTVGTCRHQPTDSVPGGKPAPKPK